MIRIRKGDGTADASPTDARAAAPSSRWSRAWRWLLSPAPIVATVIVALIVTTAVIMAADDAPRSDPGARFAGSPSLGMYARDDVYIATDGPYPAVGLYWYDSTDPRVGPGMAAPLKQLLIRTDSPSIFYKSGDANTAWTLIGSSTGGGGGVTSITCGSGLTCTPNPIVSTGTIALSGSVPTGTGTNNTVTKWTGASTLGNSAVTDDGTTWSLNGTQVQITEANGNTVIAGTLTADGTHRVFDIAGTGLTSTANTVTLNINGGVTQTCPAGQAETSLSGVGIIGCTAFAPAGNISGTTNTMAKFTSPSAVGNSSVTDDGTTWAVNSTALSVVEASGNTSIGGTCSIGGALNMNSHLINNVTDPAAAQDAATEHYVLGQVQGAVSGTSGTVPKFTGTNTIGNSSITDNATTVSINSTEFQVTESNGNVTYLGSLTGGTSGQFTVTNTGQVSEPKLTVTGSSGNNSATFQFSNTAQAASITTATATNSGTYNTTASVRTATAVSASSTATRSSGANALTNIAVDASASGGQVNWAARFNGGDVNYASGHILANGTSPTLSSCGATPSPTIAGSDIGGRFTTGGTATTCTITFATAFGTQAFCIVYPEGAATQPVYTVSASAITMTTSIATTTYDYICTGQ